MKTSAMKKAQTKNPNNTHPQVGIWNPPHR